MEYLDEEIVRLRQEEKERQYSTLETGMYINNELVNFKPIPIFDERMEVMLPDSFVPMPESLARIKYPSEQRPQVIMTSLDTGVNFTFSLFEEVPMEAFQTLFIIEQSAVIIKRVNPHYTFYGTDMEEREDTTLSWSAYKSLGVDDPVYNIIYATPVGGMFMQGNFSCLYQDYEEWEMAAHQVMMSIKDRTKEKERKL